VKFRGLCEGRNVPVLRVGVTDAQSHSIDVQELFDVTIDELSAINRATLPRRFGAVVGG
jgi:phosphoribosylformylglycinamidine synthase